MYGLPSGIHVWPGRRPQVAARAAIIAALTKAPARALSSTALRSILSAKPVHETSSATVFDPFGGGGAFALEAARLGCSVVTNDLNPVAHLIQRATIEFPLRFGSEIVELLRHYGALILQRSKAKLCGIYGKSEPGSEPVAFWWCWGLSCPRCGHWIPLLKSRQFLKGTTGTLILEVEAANGATRHKLRHVRPGMEAAGESNFDLRGTRCLCCRILVPRNEIQRHGQQGRLTRRLLAVCERRDGRLHGRDALPGEEELALNHNDAIAACFSELPYGLPHEFLTPDGDNVRAPLYGMRQFTDLFLPRQLLVLGTLVKETRQTIKQMKEAGLAPNQRAAISIYLALILGRTVERGSQLCLWQPACAVVSSAMVRYSLPFCADFAESNLLGQGSGSYQGNLRRLADTLSRLVTSVRQSRGTVRCTNRDASKPPGGRFDLIITDPPYFDSIAYANLADYFYVWFRRTLAGLGLGLDGILRHPLTPKRRGRTVEMTVDSRRFGGYRKSLRQLQRSTSKVLDGLRAALKPDGRLVLVYNCASLDGWAILAEALQQTGFRVRAVWPVQTEASGRPRTCSAKKLACSLWLCCDTRPRVSPEPLFRLIRTYQRQVPEMIKAWNTWRLPATDRRWFLLGRSLQLFTAHAAVTCDGERVSAQGFLSSVMSACPR